MSEEALSLLVELLFTAGALGATGIALACRRRVPPAATLPSAATLGELILTAGALLVAAVGPNILLVALTPGMPEMPALARYALLPSLVLLGTVWLLGFWQRLLRLTNRIWVGIWIGAAATGALDAIRLTGFHLGQMPGNMPRMFGVLILDRMALGPTPSSDIVGYVYHYWVGACFGLTYTLIAGRTRWWAGLVWGLIIEVGMMVTPPMVVAMDTGYFGLKFGLGLLVTSFIAHVAYGIVLGMLGERFVVHQGSVLGVIKQVCRKSEGHIRPATATGN